MILFDRGEYPAYFLFVQFRGAMRATGRFQRDFAAAKRADFYRARQGNPLGAGQYGQSCPPCTGGSADEIDSGAEAGDRGTGQGHRFETVRQNEEIFGQRGEFLRKKALLRSMKHIDKKRFCGCRKSAFSVRKFAEGEEKAENGG